MAQNTDTTSLTRWHALAGGALFNIALGSYYAWSVFVAPLQAEFHWTRLQTTSVASVEMVMLATMCNFAGTLIGRFGARRIAIFGGLCFSSGMLLASFSQNLLELYVSGGLLLGIGLGFGYLPPLSVGFKWFPESRGLVSGIAVGVFAAGSGIVGPLAGGFKPAGWGGLISIMGWRHTFQVLAIAYFVFTMIGSHFLVERSAEGFLRCAGSCSEAGTAPKVSAVNFTTSQIVKLPSFWIWWVAYVWLLRGHHDHQPGVAVCDEGARSQGGFCHSSRSSGQRAREVLSGWVSDHPGAC